MPPANVKARCLKCQSVFSITRVVDAIETSIAHCVFCGGEVKCGEEEGDYWTTLARDLGLPDTGHVLVQTLFDEWNPYNGDPPRFMDFARRMVDDPTPNEG